MRKSDKQESTETGRSQLFGVDFHDFLEKEASQTNMELAEEFGISLKSVKDLKRKMRKL